MTEAIDTLGMRDSMLSMPEQLEDAIASIGEISGLPTLDKVDHVLILGMGDSGFSGDVVAASARPFSARPIVVYNGHLPPSWVADRTLVIAISVSGTTEETIESLEAALGSGASLVAIANGGDLEKLARSAGAPVLPALGANPMPRASIAPLSVAPMLALEQLGLFLGARSWLSEAVEVLKRRRDELATDSSEAKVLADLVEGSTPVVYGGGTIGTTAAKRWKVSVNLNCKSPAFWAPMPDLCYNELVGWETKEAAQAYSQIQLRHDYEHPSTSSRFSFVEEKSSNVMSSVLSVKARGEGPVAQLLDLIMLGDFMSLELAAKAGVDPGPLPVIDEMKNSF